MTDQTQNPKALQYSMRVATRRLGNGVVLQHLGFAVVDLGERQRTFDPRYLKPLPDRIKATVRTQSWTHDRCIIDLDEETHDITDSVLTLDLGAIHKMKDHDHESDDLVIGTLEHRGPFEVECVGEILSYFDVEELSGITQDLLDQARILHQRHFQPNPEELTIEVGGYEIRITGTRERVLGPKRRGMIHSNLCEGDSNPDWRTAADVIEAMVLAHYVAGVDVESAPYINGLEVALEAAASNV